MSTATLISETRAELSGCSSRKQHVNTLSSSKPSSGSPLEKVSTTSLFVTNHETWDLAVDISFDDSMHAETTISCESTSFMKDYEDEAKINESDELELPSDNLVKDTTSNVSLVSTTQSTQDKSEISHNPAGENSEENSFFQLVSEFITFTRRKTDPLNRMKSDSRRRMTFTQRTQNKTSNKNKLLTKPTSKPNTSEKEVHKSIPLKTQKSCESTMTNTNQSLTDSSWFDDSIVWSVADMCAPGGEPPVDHDGTMIFCTDKDGIITKDLVLCANTPNDSNIAFPRKRLKNRVATATANAQAKYAQELRFATTFHYSHDMDIIQTTKSFGDDFREEEFIDKKTPDFPITLWIDTFGISAPCPTFLPGACLYFNGGLEQKSMRNRIEMDKGMRKSGTPTMSPVLLEESYYDSDPGFTRFRHRRPRRAFVQDHKGSRLGFLRTKSMKSKLSRFSHYTDGSRLDIEANDERVLDMYVEEMKHMRMNIIWHPSQGSRKDPMKLMRSRAWIEMGSLLSQAVIHPKFMWKSAYEPNLVRRKINVVPPYSIDLLDIVGIIPAQLINRNEHPFARPWCSFKIITVRDRYYLFEAENKEMRDKIVFGLKLIVARLASKVLVAGEVTEDEFFRPGGRQVYDTWWLDEEDSDYSDYEM